MDNTRVNRTTLLQKLEENREKHKKDFIEAKTAWENQATKALQKAAKRAEKGKITLDPLGDLPKPQSYIESYDDAIARIEMDVRDEVELSDREFSAWVQDKWAWRGTFVANTSLYNNGLD